jgi:hypothetical protein
VLVTAACGADDQGQDSTFEAIVNDVIVPRCTFSSCHTNPTIAASLDLTPERACDTLVNQPSCLFPDRMRIVPGRPEESFFFHKLTGEGLNEAPTGNCGTQTNLLMPFGASSLPADELALVHDWIAGGASCTGSGNTKPGSDTPAIASLKASRSTLLAGEGISFTVTLTKPAPERGQVVAIDMESGALSTPVQVVVPAGATVAPFDAYALRPTSRFTLRVHTGQSSKEIVLRIGGLDIAEVMADPLGGDDQLQWIKLHNRTKLPINLSGYRLKVGQSNYDLLDVGLAGTIPADGCVVIGGPTQSGTNSEPTFTQSIDFTPDLPYAGSQAAGFALFDGTASPVNGALTPVDTMLVGATNTSELLGPDAEIAIPYCGTPASGMSALRTGPGTCAQAAMQPANCQ